MFRFRVRKNPDPLLKFTQKAVLFQDISIFFVLKTELYLSSGTYFFFWKLVFHFTIFFRFNAKPEQINCSGLHGKVCMIFIILLRKFRQEPVRP